jgi:hypothetical protein
LPGLYPNNLKEERTSDPDELIHHVHFCGESYVSVHEPVVTPLPWAWRRKRLILEVKTHNEMHFTLRIGLAAGTVERKGTNGARSW